MEKRTITEEKIGQFQQFLRQGEKSRATVEKYLRDVRAFQNYLSGRSVEKELVLAYKKDLQERGYAVRSINSFLASLNSFFAFAGWTDCKVRSLRLQREIYCPEEKELSRGEYYRLLKAAQGNTRLYLVIQTICSTGIRVSELEHFTVEAVRSGEISVQCKGKMRRILLPGKLRNMLLRYAKAQRYGSGVIFRSRDGGPLSRGSIWAQMKQLCKKAGVAPEKVFPHNLRKLFARAFYNMEKDIVKLADILGHSSINTTRIYVMSTGREHRRKLEQLKLLL